jgi:hypothetical protein
MRASARNRPSWDNARDYRMAPMTKREKKRKLTDDQIDALVIADANDEAAWGEPVVVPASKSPRPAWMAQAKHLDWAAKFFVV